MFRKILGRTRIRGEDTTNSAGFQDAKVTPEGGLLTRVQGARYDIFGRQKVGEHFTLFDNKNHTFKHEGDWEEVVSGGGSVTHLPNESAVELAIGTSNGDVAIRQTRRYIAYSPGKEQDISMTMVMGPQKTNVVSRMGLFDDGDGLFLERNETDERIVLRSSASGTPSDANYVTRDNWNIDPLDGTGPSGVIIDFSFSQLMFAELLWQGVGPVKLGFDFGLSTGPVYVHEFRNANVRDTVYMKRANLPLRYEIRNIGAAASASSMKEICCVVASVGGYKAPGYGNSCSLGTITRAVNTTRIPIIAFRLKNTVNGMSNRIIAELRNFFVYATGNSVFYELAHVHNPSGITATWVSVGSDSAVEYSIDITAITGAPEHVIASGVIAATSQGSKDNPSTGGGSASIDDRHDTITQNYDSTNSQVFVIYATGFSVLGSQVTAGFKWVESE